MNNSFGVLGNNSAANCTSHGIEGKRVVVKNIVHLLERPPLRFLKEQKYVDESHCAECSEYDVNLLSSQ